MLTCPRILNLKQLVSDHLQSVHKTQFAKQVRPHHLVVQDFIREQEKKLHIRRLESTWNTDIRQEHQNVVEFYNRYRKQQQPRPQPDHTACYYATVFPEYSGRPEINVTSVPSDSGSTQVSTPVFETPSVSQQTDRATWWTSFFPGARSLDTQDS